MKKIAPKPSQLPALAPQKKDLPALPTSAPDGTIMVNASKYARQAVLTAFEMIGGTEELAKWGKDNKGDFYKSIFSKTIQKDIEVGARDDVEGLLERLDKERQDKKYEEDEELTIDAEFEMVEGEYDGI